MQDGGLNAYDFKAEEEEEDADMEKLKALAGAPAPACSSQRSLYSCAVTSP